MEVSHFKYIVQALALCLLPILVSSQRMDPMCANKWCPKGQTCRLFKPCGAEERCNITTICTDVKRLDLPYCNIGSAVLVKEKGTLDYLPCYTKAPCPYNAYCSTVLMDVGSACCLSDPDKTENEGVCPYIAPDPSRFFCVDECKSDGDCFHEDKCCFTGCSLGCVSPEPVKPKPPPVQAPWDPCKNKVCPGEEKCRLEKPCGAEEKCNLTAVCTSVGLTRGYCKFGYAVLNQKGDDYLPCYTKAPCPYNAYCSTVLMDVGSACCLSDPDKTEKKGECPVIAPDPSRFFCVDECKSDGDCFHNSKCCFTGCSLGCVAPKLNAILTSTTSSTTTTTTTRKTTTVVYPVTEAAPSTSIAPPVTMIVPTTPAPVTEILPTAGSTTPEDKPTPPPTTTPAQPVTGKPPRETEYITESEEQPWDACAEKVCPKGKTCRLIKPCGVKEMCDLKAICYYRRDTTKTCKYGGAILVEENGSLGSLWCHKDAPCPHKSYCSTAIIGPRSVCCLSDPVIRKKGGRCPAFFTEIDSFFCVDRCQSDGDCDGDLKCCFTGCSMQCSLPEELLIGATEMKPPRKHGKRKHGRLSRGHHGRKISSYRSLIKRLLNWSSYPMDVVELD